MRRNEPSTPGEPSPRFRLPPDAIRSHGAFRALSAGFQAIINPALLLAVHMVRPLEVEIRDSAVSPE